jgi:hypothetical protein
MEPVNQLPNNAPVSGLLDESSPDELEEKRKESFNWLYRDARGKHPTFSTFLEVERRRMKYHSLILRLEPAYISYSPFSNFSVTSFDFGVKGVAVSCNSGGELLYLLAPSKKDGLISVRGDFETSLYSSLARTQKQFGGPSTFGFEISTGRKPFKPESEKFKELKGSSLRLGDMLDG